MEKKKYAYKYGGKRGKKIILVESPDMVVVRTKGNKELEKAEVSQNSRDLIEAAAPVVEFPEAGIQVLKMPGDTLQQAQIQRDVTREALKKEEDIRFAGRVLQDEESGEAVLYTENFFVKFYDKTEEALCLELLQKYALEVKNKLFFAKNAYFVCVKEGTGLEIFDLADALLKEKEVEYCHPELVQERRYKLVHPLQWHLTRTIIGQKEINAHVGIEGAWQHTRGAGTTIAVIDDGFDLKHPEFAGRIVAPFDATSNNNDPSPKTTDENHGTACAGVALAAGLNGGASGTAPEAKFMPVRLRSGLGSMAEAQAFGWAAQNGADVISCSWGPPDGRWWDPMDPLHNRNSILPDSTRLAMDFALKEGRNGKGCVILFAAGNGNESTDNDGYASHPSVITVAACNDRGTRSVYSDFGKAITCAFPSGDFAWRPFLHPAPNTAGIRTTDRLDKLGLDLMDYTNAFSGTSAACPGMAGVVALMLAANPDLGPKEVKDLVQQSCEKIDRENGDYDRNGHSPLYGYGRINAQKAVENALKSTKKEEKPPQTDLLSGFVQFSDRRRIRLQLGRWMLLRGKKLSGLHLQLNEPEDQSRIRIKLNISGFGVIETMNEKAYIGARDGRHSLYGISLQLVGPMAATHDLIYATQRPNKGGIDAAQNGGFIGKESGLGAPLESLIVLLKAKK